MRGTQSDQVAQLGRAAPGEVDVGVVGLETEALPAPGDDASPVAHDQSGCKTRRNVASGRSHRDNVTPRGDDEPRRRLTQQFRRHFERHRTDTFDFAGVASAQTATPERISVDDHERMNAIALLTGPGLPSSSRKASRR